MSRATSAIGRDVSITIFTASSLNSCVNFLRRSGILHPPFRAGLYWIRCPESPRHANSAADPGGGANVEVKGTLTPPVAQTLARLKQIANDEPVTVKLPAQVGERKSGGQGISVGIFAVAAG